MREFLNAFQKVEFDKVKSYIQRYTISDLGREHLQKLAPASSPDVIRTELALVSEVKTLLETDEVLPLDGLFDVRASLHRASIEDFVLASEDLHRIAEVIRTSRAVHAYFGRRTTEYPLVASLLKPLYHEKVLEYNINRAIDDEGGVKSTASKELGSIRRQITEKSASLKESLQKILKVVAGKEWAQEDIITTREGRMVIPVKVEHKNHVPGFIHSASASGATVFIEPAETLDMNNDIRTLQFQEQREIQKILKELTKQVREAQQDLLTSVQILGELDFIVAKAKYSIECIGTAPAIDVGIASRLINAYHPILLQKHGRKDVVPLTMELSPEVHTLIITGPNAGGKSVTMKTIGLLSIMAQSGCHIPASPESSLPVFTDVFVDMGDEQSIENDLSSFSSHLENLKGVLQHANASSLVLLDEIGSGTDPVEGSSLAAAILERLTEIGSLTIATTHHGMLKAVALKNPNIQNAAMEFDQATLRPTYRFKLGIPGSSYAIEMAERLSLPEEIIRRSRLLKGAEAVRLEDLIVDLERKSQEVNRSLARIADQKVEVEVMKQLYEKKLSSLQEELKARRLQALDEARGIVDRANALVEKSVREIRETSAGRASIAAAKDNIRQLADELKRMKREELPEPAAPPGFEPGQTVRLKETDTIGEIESKLDERQYLIIVGGMRMKAGATELEPVTVETSPRRAGHLEETTAERPKTEIDLRGMYGDEAISAVDKFLDEAVLAGLHRVDLIHGKGTGALRKKIAQYLQSNPAIKSFRLGEWNEGGSGVTVVELK